MRLTATYPGGPTALIKISGVRFITDPTFDPAASSYETAVYTLHNTIGPALVPQPSSLRSLSLIEVLDHCGRYASRGAMPTTRTPALFATSIAVTTS